MERATGAEPARSSLGTNRTRETAGKTETKRAKFSPFLDQRQPLSDPNFRRFPAEWPEFYLKATSGFVGWQSGFFGVT